MSCSWYYVNALRSEIELEVERGRGFGITCKVEIGASGNVRDRTLGGKHSQ